MKRKKYDNGSWIKDSNGWGFSNNHDSNRAAKHRNKARWWWLRSPGGIDFSAAGVRGDGIVYVFGDRFDSKSGGVRPALWLNLCGGNANE
jgi:hypothetical protein